MPPILRYLEVRCYSLNNVRTGIFIVFIGPHEYHFMVLRWLLHRQPPFPKSEKERAKRVYELFIMKPEISQKRFPEDSHLHIFGQNCVI